MRITNIRFEQKTNLGNYESFGFSADAALGEDDNIAETTAKLANYVDWHAKKPVRDITRRNYQMIFNDPNAPADKKAEAELWLAKYNTRATEMEAM